MSNFDIFFLNQLLKDINLLSNEEFEIFFNGLEHEIVKTLEFFQK